MSQDTLVEPINDAPGPDASEVASTGADLQTAIVDSAPTKGRFTRRRFVIGGGVVAAVVASGLGSRWLFGDEYDSADGTYPLRDQPPEPLTASATTTPSTAEVAAQPATGEFTVRTEYTLSELAAWAHRTTFGDQSPAHLKQLTREISDAPTVEIAKANSQAAIKQMTGRDLTFNISDFETKETLPNTRSEIDSGLYKSGLSSFLQMIGTLPRTFVEQPNRYNIQEEYALGTTSDGRETIDTGIIGQAVHSADALLLDAGYLTSRTTLMHEFTHIGQFATPDYFESSSFTQLRKAGEAAFGSPRAMHEQLEQICTERAAMGDLTYGSGGQNSELAFRLLRTESSRPDVRWEDEAYTVSTTIDHGFLPEQPDHDPANNAPSLLGYLREKQILAIENLSRMAGTDMGAALALTERLPHTHPKTLASLHGQDILENMSVLDAGPLSANPRTGETRLGTGTHFVDIGSGGQPEIIQLIASNTEVDGYGSNTASDGLYNVYLAFEQPEPSSQDLSLPPPTTTTLPAAPESGSTPPTAYPAEFITPEQAFVESILDIIAPGLKGQLGMGYDGGYGIEIVGEDGGRIGNRPILPAIKLTINANTLAQFIDTSRVVGRINDELVYQAA